MIMTTAQSRLSALTILVVCVVLLLSLVVYPVAAQYRLQAREIAMKSEQLVRYQALAADHDRLKQQLTRLSRQSPAADYYVSGVTPALAAAMMQKHLEQLVESSGGELISTQILADKDAPATPNASLKVHVKADMDTCLKIVYGLESGRPMLFLDNVFIFVRPLRRRGQSKILTFELDMQFDITGYLQGEA